MQNPIQDKFRTCFVLTLIILLAACSSGDAQLEGELLTTKRRLEDLTNALEVGSLRNASIILQYSSVLQRSRPELAPLMIQLEKEATTSNPAYESLQQRYSVVRDETEHFDSWVEKVEELKLIQTAANTSSFNDSLSDTVNVIADLSNGALARVNAVNKETESSMNKSQDFGAGSQYMGNPHYGHWNHSSGGSYWAWYGQYRFFSSMFGGNRYYYNDWAGRRGYSYYSDIGRNSYTSRSQRSGQREVASRAKKQFGSSGKFKSPYAKARTGATGMSKASTAQQKSAFKSPYSRSTASKSKYQSSTRNSSFRTSRGTSRGK
jgi:hypothetical protein